MQTFLRILLFALLLGGTSNPGLAWAQDIHRLTIETSVATPADAAGNRSATVTIRAVDSAGRTVSSAQDRVQFRATLHPAPGVVISEFTFDGAEIEFTNVGTDPVDLTGWMLEVATGGNEVAPSALHRIAGPAILGPGGTLVWSSRPDATNAFPRLAHSSPFHGYSGATIQLYDASAQLVDQLLLTTPVVQRETIWSGPPVSINRVETGSIRRIGGLNQLSSMDWVAGPSSIGDVNPGLLLPFIGRRTPCPVTPDQVRLEQGMWTGTVTFPAGSAQRWRLGASISNQVQWETDPLLLPAAPLLSLSLIEGTLGATEASTGFVARVRVQLPPGQVANGALPIPVTFDAPGEFIVPGPVVIPDGQASAEFEVHNVDDSIADGRSRVRLQVTAAGLGVTTLPFTQDDNERGRLVVILPEEANEDAGRLSRPGRLMLAEPALHDIEVQLSASGRIAVPPSVLIPAGSRFATFPLQVLGDDFLNVLPTRDVVHAQTAGWPASSAAMRVTDNESVLFQAEVPRGIPEGTTQYGSLIFNSRVDQDLRVDLRVAGNSLHIPDTVVLPAGTNRVQFPIHAPDDLIARTDVPVTICPSTGFYEARCLTLVPVDNDFPLTGVQVAVGSPALTGDGVRISVAIVSDQGAPTHLQGTAQVRIRETIQPIRIEPGSSVIPIVDGRFEGVLRMVGASERVVLEVEFGDVRGSSLPFEVQAGRTVEGAYADVATWPGRTPLLALQIATNGPAILGSLVEVEPTSGTILRRMPLPRPAHRIAVSDTGTVAWLASTEDTLQRVQLDSWTHAGEFPLEATNGTRAALVLAISSGAPDEVAALIGPTPDAPPANHEVIAFRAGQQLSRKLDLGPNSYSPGLIPGRSAGEFHTVLNLTAHRLRLLPDGVESIVSRSPVSPGHLPAIHPVLVGSNIVYGGGIIVDADSLEDRGEYSAGGQVPTRTAVLSFPERGRLLFADQLGMLRTFGIDDRTMSGSSSVPWTSNGPIIDRMVRWGSQGAAILSWTSRQLFLLEDPVRLPAVADLAVSLAMTNRLAWRGDTIQLPMVPTTILITNAGPDAAQQVSLLLGATQIGFWPLIPAGGSVELSPNFGNASIGSNSFTVSATSAIADPSPDNNSASASVWVEPLVTPGESIIQLPARHLVARPGANELWAAVGPESGAEGIAVLDAVTLERRRTIPVGPDPRQIAAMANGAGFYVRLGTNRIVRWNLAEDRIDLDRTFLTERLVDLASIGEPVERLAVLFMERLLVIEGNQDIQSLTLLPSLSRRLASFGNQLWAAREREIRVYTADPTRLTLLRTQAILTPSSQLRFTTDGSWAAFDGYLVHPELGLTQNVGSSGVPWMPGFDGTFYGFSGKALIRMELSNFFAAAAEAVILALNNAGPIADQVRWSTNGFAFRTEGGFIVSTRSPLVRRGTADLGISITALGTPLYLVPSEFKVTVTNRGPDAVERVQLAIGRAQADWIRVESPAVYDFDRVRLLLGPIPVGGSQEARVTILPNQYPSPIGWVSLTASLTAPASDPTPEDASVWAQFQVSAIQANLGVSIQAPPQPVLNVPFEVVCTLTNAGPGTVPHPNLYFWRSTTLQWLETDRGNRQDLSSGDILLTDVVPSLPPGTSTTVRIRMKSTRPGIFPLAASPNFAYADPAPEDNHSRVVLHIPPTNAITDFPHISIDLPKAAWSRTRRQWIAWDNFGLVYLHPDTLAPVGGMRFPFESTPLFLNDEGTHFWMTQDYLGYVRCNLETGAPDLRIDPTENPIPGQFTATAIPGRPDMLVAFGLTPENQMKVVAFANGKALPDQYSDDLGWQGSALTIGADEGQRVYVSNGAQFRELEITATGLRLDRNLDAYRQNSDAPMSVAAGLLVQGGAPVLDLATLTRTQLGFFWQPFIDGFTHRSTTLPDGSSRMEAFNAATRMPIWWMPNASFRTAVANGGTHGLLVLGGAGGMIRPPADQSVDLRLSAPNAPFIRGAGRDFNLTLVLRQSGQWVAGNTHIGVELPPGIELIEPSPTGNPSGFTIPFVLPSTNITLRMRAANAGPARVVFRARSEAVDPTPDDAIVALDLVIPEEPAVVLTDVVTADNGVPFALRLSTPAPDAMTVTLVSHPISTETNDLVSPTMNVQFNPGQQEAQISWVRADSTVEADEEFWMSVTSPVGPANTNVVRVTIRNDDRAQLVARSETRAEGNTNAPPGLFNVFTDATLETTVELGFNTSGITATSGSDFLPLSGRIVLGPGQPTNTIRVVVLGDTTFEPNETLTLLWSDPSSVRLPVTTPTLTLLNDDPPPAPELSIRIDAENRPVITLPTTAGYRYGLQSRPLLSSGSWVNDGQSFLSTGAPLSLRSGFRADSMRFYRVQVN